MTDLFFLFSLKKNCLLFNLKIDFSDLHTLLECQETFHTHTAFYFHLHFLTTHTKLQSPKNGAKGAKSKFPPSESIYFQNRKQLIILDEIQMTNKIHIHNCLGITSIDQLHTYLIWVSTNHCGYLQELKSTPSNSKCF